MKENSPRIDELVHELKQIQEAKKKRQKAFDDVSCEDALKLVEKRKKKKKNESVEIEEAKKDLYVVTKPFATRGGRDALFQKGDKLRVVSVDRKKMAKVTLPDGERIGITIPLQNLKKIKGGN